MFLWFSYGFPMVFLWFYHWPSYCDFEICFCPCGLLAWNLRMAPLGGWTWGEITATIGMESTAVSDHQVMIPSSEIPVIYISNYKFMNVWINMDHIHKFMMHPTKNTQLWNSHEIKWHRNVFPMIFHTIPVHPDIYIIVQWPRKRCRYNFQDGSPMMLTFWHLFLGCNISN